MKSNHGEIVESLSLAEKQVERLVILSLTLLSGGRSNAAMPECQEQEIDRWIFDLADDAAGHIKKATALVHETNLMAE